MIKYHDKSNLKEKKLILAHNSRGIQSLVVRKSEQQAGKQSNGNRKVVVTFHPYLGSKA